MQAYFRNFSLTGIEQQSPKHMLEGGQGHPQGMRKKYRSGICLSVQVFIPAQTNILVVHVQSFFPFTDDI